MNYLKIALVAFISISVLFAFTKLMGRKQISQLSYFDYIVGISIGSIAAEMATEPMGEMWDYIVAMAVYALLALSISYITTKSFALRKFFTGSPVVLIENGIIMERNMRRVHYDINDMLEECRYNGYFDISTIRSALMESNGRISFLPFATQRAVTPKDCGISVPEDSLCANVIIDGKTLQGVLYAIGRDERWLTQEVNRQNARVNEVLLGIVQSNGNLRLYMKNPRARSKNVLE